MRQDDITSRKHQYQLFFIKKNTLVRDGAFCTSVAPRAALLRSSGFCSVLYVLRINHHNPPPKIRIERHLSFWALVQFLDLLSIYQSGTVVADVFGGSSRSTSLSSKIILYLMTRSGFCYPMLVTAIPVMLTMVIPIVESKLGSVSSACLSQ